MLTYQDYTVLIEAVDAWVNKDVANELMDVLFTGMIAGGDKQVLNELRADRNEKRLSKEIEVQKRQETAIILKAKLLQLRNALPIEETR